MRVGALLILLVLLVPLVLLSCVDTPQPVGRAQRADSLQVARVCTDEPTFYYGEAARALAPGSEPVLWKLLDDSRMWGCWCNSVLILGLVADESALPKFVSLAERRYEGSVWPDGGPPRLVEATACVVQAMGDWSERHPARSEARTWLQAAEEPDFWLAQSVTKTAGRFEDTYREPEWAAASLAEVARVTRSSLLPSFAQDAPPAVLAP